MVLVAYPKDGEFRIAKWADGMCLVRSDDDLVLGKEAERTTQCIACLFFTGSVVDSKILNISKIAA